MLDGVLEPLCGSADNANIAFSPQSVNIRLFFWISGACSRIYRNDRTVLWLYYTKCSLGDNIGKNGAGYCICFFFFYVEPFGISNICINFAPHFRRTKVCIPQCGVSCNFLSKHGFSGLCGLPFSRATVILCAIFRTKQEH